MRPRYTIIGVTGVIGAGKSAACRYLVKKHGFYWISADEIVYLLYKRAGAGYRAIYQNFGRKFVGKKCVDRKKLLEYVAENPEQFFRLNRIMHPLIASVMNKKIAQLKSQGKDKICIEAFYFRKQGLGKFATNVWKIDATDEILLKRIIRRPRAKAHLLAVLAFQRSQQQRAARVIENNSSLLSLYKKIDYLMAKKYET